MKSNTLIFYLLVSLFHFNSERVTGQNAWPASIWGNSENLSALLPSAFQEQSGIYFSSSTNRLFVVGDNGYFGVLQLNLTTNKFSLLGYVKTSDGPEGVTQVNPESNEIYTIDENTYQIRKYLFNSNFSTLTKQNSWNILLPPSTMINTDNTGPEGICFVPNSYLQRIGFISSVTQQPYLSTKGMGGLLFIAHQDGGYVWVFDINPTVDNDFNYVGKYLTSRNESCDLAFDRSTGLMYILHNIDKNYLEVTNLKTTLYGTEYMFDQENEFFISNPSSGSDNIEGFAISPKYPINQSVGAWLCRDVSKTSENSDALKWFHPFNADGSQIETAIHPESVENNKITISENGNRILFSSIPTSTVNIYTTTGNVVAINPPSKCIELNLAPGAYILAADNQHQLFIKK